MRSTPLLFAAALVLISGCIFNPQPDPPGNAVSAGDGGHKETSEYGAGGTSDSGTSTSTGMGGAPPSSGGAGGGAGGIADLDGGPTDAPSDGPTEGGCVGDGGPGSGGQGGC